MLIFRLLIMDKENPRFYRRESGLIVPDNGQVTSEDIDVMFGIDLRERVINRLRAFGFLPDGHELTFFSKGQEHNGSQALYLVEEAVAGHMVYVSFLSPNGKTTIHKHDHPLKENYFWLAGASFLRIDGDVHELRQGQELVTVPSGSVHQLTTRGEASLALIVMENAAQVPADRLHIPVSYD